MRWNHSTAVLLAFAVVGCGEKKEPLLSHGKPVAYWMEELKKPNPKARRKAVVALGHVGTADPAAIPALIGAVQDRDPRVRSEVILALLNIGTDASDAIPAVTEALHDPDATVRSLATKALERIRGP